MVQIILLFILDKTLYYVRILEYPIHHNPFNSYYINNKYMYHVILDLYLNLIHSMPNYYQDNIKSN